MKPTHRETLIGPRRDGSHCDFCVILVTSAGASLAERPATSDQRASGPNICFERNTSDEVRYSRWTEPLDLGVHLFNVAVSVIEIWRA